MAAHDGSRAKKKNKQDERKKVIKDASMELYLKPYRPTSVIHLSFFFWNPSRVDDYDLHLGNHSGG